MDKVLIFFIIPKSEKVILLLLFLSRVVKKSYSYIFAEKQTQWRAENHDRGVPVVFSNLNCTVVSRKLRNCSGNPGNFRGISASSVCPRVVCRCGAKPLQKM